MLQGLSRFLVQHERCGAGFDVAHPAGLGSGRVSITCRGCGARHEYATATIEVERELKIEPAERRAQPQPPAPAPRPEPPAQIPEPPAQIPPRPAPYPDSVRPPAPSPPPSGATGDTAAAPPSGDLPPVGPGPTAGAAPAQRTSPSPHATPPATGLQRPGAPPLRRPPAESALARFWRSPRATLALLVVAAVALGIAVVRLVNDNGGSSPRTTPAATATSPTPGAPPATTTPAPAPSGTAPTPVPAPRPSSTTLRTRNFTLQAPAGWTDRTSAGGLLLQPRGGGRVNVQVYFQRSPGLSRSQMAHQTARFLRHEVPGASLFPRQITIAGRPAYEITARGPGETAIAVDVLRGPYRYLLLRRIFAGATPQVSVAASRVVLSFRPR
jgi:hypothetical protein